MKKLVVVVLMMAMLCSLAACNGENGGIGPTTAQAYDIYTKANAAMENINSMIADTNMKISMTVMDETMDIEMGGQIKEIINSETDIQLAMEMHTEIAGQATDMNVYFLDGYYYMDVAGMKTKMAMPLDQVMAQVNTETLDFSSDAVKEQKVEDTAEGQQLTFVLDGSKLTEYVDSIMGGMEQMLGTTDDVSMELGDIAYTVLISNDELKSTEMSFDFNMNIMGEEVPVSAEVTLDFIQLNDVTIDFPADLDTYTEGSY